MEQRHEWKHLLNGADLVVLRQRLRAVMEPDPHAGPDGEYRIRSLYFDNLRNKALREKLDGVSCREKFRLRYYNGDAGLIHLEKKSKRGALGGKAFEPVTAGETRALLRGDAAWMDDPGRPLVFELFQKMRTQGLRPRTIVEYVREPFVYAPGNVRVTLDRDLRTGLSAGDFLEPEGIVFPAGEPVCLLEVKWDAYLPDAVRDAVQLRGRQATAFSKYAACRIYG